MNATMPICIALALAPFAPKTSEVHKILHIGNYSLCLKIGEGRALAHCTFDVDCDGDVQDLMVHAEDTNITNYLTLDQIEQIEVACFESYLKDAQENNTDLAIMRWESAQ